MTRRNFDALENSVHCPGTRIRRPKNAAVLSQPIKKAVFQAQHRELRVVAYCTAGVPGLPGHHALRLGSSIYCFKILL